MPRWLKGLFTLISLLLVGVSLLAYLGSNANKGTKFPVTAKEFINYSEAATEQDAKGLGEALQEIGYFTGEKEKEVLLHKEGAATVISFVVKDGKWDDEAVVSGFRRIGEKVALTVGGDAVSVDLLDDRLNSKKAFPIDRRVLRAAKQERINYHKSVPRSEAEALADALKQAKYFDGSAPCDISLDKGENGSVVSYVVVKGAWDRPETVKFYRELSGKVADAVGGKPLTVRLIDADLTPQKEFTVE
jgi:hypothetical protein